MSSFAQSRPCKHGRDFRKIIMEKKALLFMLVSFCSLIVACSQPSQYIPLDDSIVYTSDFSRGLDGYSVNPDFISLEIVEKDNGKVLKITRKPGTPWWIGVKLDLSKYLKSNTDYFFSVDMFHENNNRISLGMFLNNAEADRGGRNYELDGGAWANLKGTASLEYLSNPYMFFKSHGDNEIYYIRNIVVREIKIDSSTAANYEYSMHELAKKGNFKFGTILGYNQLKDINYTNFIKRHYNILSCGNWIFLDHDKSKQNAIDNPENPMPMVNFEECDLYFEFAKENNMMIRGHALFNGFEFNNWIFRDNYTDTGNLVSKEAAQKRMEYYIKTIITHYETKYPGITYGWDVINENFICEEIDGIPNPFYTYFGRDYVKMMYSFAKKYSSVKLFYNDWATYGKHDRERIIGIADWLNDGIIVNGYDGNPLRGMDGELVVQSGTKLIDGVGMESYIPVYGTDILAPNAENFIMTVIREYNEAGLEVQLTETTIINYDNSKEGQKKHAEFLYILLQTLMTENPKLQAEGLAGLTCVTFWSVTDSFDLLENDYAFGLAGLASGFLDYSYKPKPAFYAVIAALKREKFPF